jgi:hypothetical protein
MRDLTLTMQYCWQMTLGNSVTGQSDTVLLCHAGTVHKLMCNTAAVLLAALRGNPVPMRVPP